MGIETLHPQYSKRLPQWQRCMDCFEGSDRIKSEERRTTYLPTLSGQNDVEYVAYITRALFFNATGRTVQGLVGAMVRNEPTFKLPGAMDDWTKDLTPDHHSAVELVKQIGEAILLYNRALLLVDRPEVDESRGIEDRPYIAMYDALAITNWQTEPFPRVVLKETFFERDEKDEYSRRESTQYRELLLLDGVYTQRLWRKVPRTQTGPSKSEEYGIYRTITPTRRGQRMTELPVVWLSMQGLVQKIEKSPLLDLVDVNISHFHNSADLEHGRHFTALPTPWVSGVSAEELGGKMRIGSATAWALPNPQSRAGFLEFSGQGLAAIAEGMRSKEEMMAALGARLLQQPRRTQVEAAETARIHASGEVSALTAVAVAAEEGLEKALEIAREWEGVSGKVEARLNRDFIDTRLAPQELTALLSAWQQGGISIDTFLWNLKQGELLPPDDTIDEEKARIEASNAEQERLIKQEGGTVQRLPRRRNFTVSVGGKTANVSEQ